MVSERAEKEVEIERLSSDWASSTLAICADYRGLTVAKIMDLRKQLKQVGARCGVVKNTLALLAINRGLDGSNADQIERLRTVFTGPSFLVFANEDVVSPAKVLEKFSKDNEIFQVKGGWFEGSFLNKAEVIQIASMPSREELLAKVLYLINAPATQVARVVQAPAQQVVQVLNAYKGTL